MKLQSVNDRPLLLKRLLSLLIFMALGTWIAPEASAYDTMKSVMTSAWENRDMDTINKARSLGWDFGSFVQGKIESDLETCHSEALSTGDMRGCENTATEAWDEVLNSEYQFLMTQVEDKEGLRELQRAWIKYRDLKCSWTGHWLGSAGSIATAACFGDMTSQRTLEIISANSCFMEEGCLW